MTSPAETLALCEKLDALLEKATPGEWKVSKMRTTFNARDYLDGDYRIVSFKNKGYRTNPDAALIAAMKNALPALLRAAREGVAARKDAERYRFLKYRLTVPGAMHHFLRFNNLHPETKFEPSMDAAIDAALKEPK